MLGECTAPCKNRLVGLGGVILGAPMAKDDKHPIARNGKGFKFWSLLLLASRLLTLCFGT